MKLCDQELLLYTPISTQLYEIVKVNHLAAYSILFIILMGVMRNFLEAFEMLLNPIADLWKLLSVHQWR